MLLKRAWQGAHLAEQTKRHLWVNTAIAGGALAISAIAVFISWQSYSLNVESFGFNSSFTYDCPLSIGLSKENNSPSTGTTLGLCWQVTMANQSGSRASAVKFSSSRASENRVSENKNSRELLTVVYEIKGGIVSLPMSFDGGEARTLIAVILLPVTDALGSMISGDSKRSQRIETFNDVAAIASKAKLDVLGNPVSVDELASFGYLIRYPSDYKKTVITFRAHTGRNKVFETQLTYPDAPIALVFLKATH